MKNKILVAPKILIVSYPTCSFSWKIQQDLCFLRVLQTTVKSPCLNKLSSFKIHTLYLTHTFYTLLSLSRSAAQKTLALEKLKQEIQIFSFVSAFPLFTVTEALVPSQILLTHIHVLTILRILLFLFYFRNLQIEAKWNIFS